MKYFLLATLAAGIAGTPCFAQDVWISSSVQLTDRGLWLRVDNKRNVAYVSVANADGVAVISLDSATVLKTLPIGPSPAGIDLSADGDTLYSALNGQGSLGVYDLVHDTADQIDIRGGLDHVDAWDVAETSPGLVFVSGGMYNGGHMVRVDVAARQATLVNAGTYIGTRPRLGKDPNGLVLYVADGDGSSFLKLDITQATAPVSQQARFFEGQGAYMGIAANPTGDKLVIGGGAILRAGELTRDGYVSQGVALYSSDGSSIASAHGENLVVDRFDAVMLDPIETVATRCTMPHAFPWGAPSSAIAALANDKGWVIAGGDTVCVVRQVPDEIFAGNFE